MGDQNVNKLKAVQNYDEQATKKEVICICGLKMKKETISCKCSNCLWISNKKSGVYRCYETKIEHDKNGEIPTTKYSLCTLCADAVPNYEADDNLNEILRNTVFPYIISPEKFGNFKIEPETEQIVYGEDDDDIICKIDRSQFVKRKYGECLYVPAMNRLYIFQSHRPYFGVFYQQIVDEHLRMRYIKLRLDLIKGMVTLKQRSCICFSE